MKKIYTTAVFLILTSLSVFAQEKKNQETPIQTIKRVFDGYVKYGESTDSKVNKADMTKSLQALKTVTQPEDLELLINVWMYYDPTDYADIPLVYKVLKQNKNASIQAVKARIKNKKDWEQEGLAPYSDLPKLLQRLEDEK
ncbi:MAG: hypothetical protein JWM14_873 [Chitinophagaceae bacterium]|nr:hypothetical protein [Chitinophagaceae bacterium]